MILVLSGEGPADLGTCTNALGQCNGDDFAVGPLMVLIDQMLTPVLGFSLRALPDQIYYRSETKLCERAKALPGRLQPARSKKKAAETGYFFANAVALGVIASELEAKTQRNAIAILHRDCDVTRSTRVGLWKTKHQSMMDGFRHSQFIRGVPMLPKPTSEAWLLCAAKTQAYLNCAQLEELPGNEASPSHPKKKLDEAFGRHKTAAELCDWLDEHPFEVDRACVMESFKRFKERLDEVLMAVKGAQVMNNCGRPHEKHSPD